MKDRIINRKIREFNDRFVGAFLNKDTTESDQFYAMTLATQDFISMMIRMLSASLPPQESKAAMKVIVDTALIKYGMSLKIDEFTSLSSSLISSGQ